jgi:DNA-binding response OmpR family regulator
MDVAVLRWPLERERVDELRRAGRPRLLLVEDGGPPPAAADHLEDWIRVPAPEHDVEARVAQLRRRAAPPTAPPLLDDNEVLWRGDRWVALPPVEARLIRVLLERGSAVISRDAMMRAGWPESQPNRNVLDVHVVRLRRRLEPLGLAIHTVRSRGFLLQSAVPE